MLMKGQSSLSDMLLLYLKTEMTCDVDHSLPDARRDDYVLKLDLLREGLDRVVVHVGSCSVYNSGFLFMVGN